MHEEYGTIGGRVLRPTPYRCSACYDDILKRDARRLARSLVDSLIHNPMKCDIARIFGKLCPKLCKERGESARLFAGRHEV
jgi:hypothetical protein